MFGLLLRVLAEQPVSPVDHIAEYLVRFRGSGVLVAVENVVAEYAVGLVAVLGYGTGDCARHGLVGTPSAETGQSQA